jgi:uncharacterized protein (DUF2336 family)
LREATPLLDEPRGLRVLFDALGDDVKPEALREVEHHADDFLVAHVVADAGGERAIELEVCGRQAAQVRERRVAHAEVVDRRRDTQLTQALEPRDDELRVAHRRALGQLDHQPPDSSGCASSSRSRFGRKSA